MRVTPNPKRCERFDNEIEAITRLTAHPNVIDVIDYGAFKEPSKPTYVMPEAEYSLQDYVIGRNLTVDDSLCLFEQVVAGIEHLHKCNIIHRDVKPDNVLMFGVQPKVSDFGLCLIADTPRVTPTEEAVGPRFYMAPELEDGRHLDVNLRADIYSLGKILYFLLSGGKVFSREKFRDPRWNLAKILGDDRFRLFEQIFSKTIAPERDRYTDCTELRSDVSRVWDKYRNDPQTTLEAKIPNVAVLLDGTRKQLDDLNDREWVELLELRARKGALYSEAIVLGATAAISEKTAESFGIELLRVRTSLDRKRLTNLAALVVKASEHVSRYSHQQGEDLRLLALEDSSLGALHAVAKDSLGQTPRVLVEVARRVHDLDEDCLDSFLMTSFMKAYPGRRDVLLNLSRENITRNQPGFVVAGLMDDGSDPALERIAELMRERSSIEEMTELIQGMALRATPEKYKSLVSKGGYSKHVLQALTLLAEVSERALRKGNDDEEDSSDE